MKATVHLCIYVELSKQDFLRTVLHDKHYFSRFKPRVSLGF